MTRANKESRIAAFRIALAIVAALGVKTGAVNAAESGVTVLPATEVTASPIIEDNKVDAFSGFSTTVTQDQMRDLNAIDLPSALRMTPGVEISRFDQVGSYNGNQGGSVYIRGIGTSRPGSEIKTYVDGLPVYMGVWNHPLLDLLPVNAMQSITVHKSPQPHISGNNFASINLETKRAVEDGLHGSGRLAVGSYGTVIEQADLTGRKDGLDLSLAAGHAKSNGHRSNSDGGLKNLLGRVGAKLNDIWSIGASVLSVNNSVGDPGSNLVAPPVNPARNESATNMVTAFISHRSGDWSGEFRAYSNNGKNDLFNDSVWGTFSTHFSMSGFKLKEQFSPWSNGTIVAGMDSDSTNGDVLGPNTAGIRIALPKFTVTSTYAAVSQKVALSDGWTAVPSAGVRGYSHNQYQTKYSPHAGLSVMSEKVTVYSNVSRGISYPGLEGPGLQAALPAGLFSGTTWNRLSPEEMNHKEIGVKYSPAEATQIDLSVFRDDISNRVIYTMNFATFGANTFQNLGSYRTNGFELSVRQQISADWKLFAGWTHLDSSLSTLPYAPANAMTLGVNGRVGPMRLVLDAQHQSSMYGLTYDRNVTPATVAANRPVNAFTVANARLSYPLPALGKKGEAYVAVENIFNNAYAFNPGYPMPGRTGQIGIMASF